MIMRFVFGFWRLGFMIRCILLVLVVVVFLHLLMLKCCFFPRSNTLFSHPKMLYVSEPTVNIIDKNKTNTEFFNQSKLIFIVDKPTENIFYLGKWTFVDLLFNNQESLCPTIENNSNLVGHVGQAVLLIENLEEFEVQLYSTDIKPGGHWKPLDCKARYKIAIIIPYRDKKSFLVRLLEFLIPFLKKQYLDFRFIVAEQAGNELFNRGSIMNAGFVLAQKLNVDCVIFHDVDMFPQDDHVPYGCPPTPRHLGAFVNNLGYQANNENSVGGVLALRMDQFIKLNGFSNMYWAWGNEDNDFGTRILSLNYTIERLIDVHYSMLKHVKQKRLGRKKKLNLMKTASTRSKFDGLNETNKWKVVKLDVKPLYYHLLVEIGKPPKN